MFPEFQLVPWLYFLPLLSWVLLLLAFFLKKAFLPLAISSGVVAASFLVFGLAYGMGLPVLCAFCAVEGGLLFLPLYFHKKEGA